jgi:antitoxin component YwqK of YwqJK toxin-antitoxin module
MMAISWGKRFGMALVLVAGQVALASMCLAAADQDTVKIEPYKGPPIFLPEAKQVAKPKIVTRETIKEKYEDDKTLRVEREVAKYSDESFKADGKYKEYHPNGKPFIEGQFKEGNQEGEWTYYFDNGQINRKAIYKDGKPDGSWDTFRADGTLQAKRSFKEGLRDGEWITYDDTGKIPLTEEHYAKGEPDGVVKVYFPSGKIRRQVNFKNGKQDGAFVEWNDQGEKLAEINYVDGKLDGAATRYLPGGKKIVQTYKDGKFVSETKD